MVHYVVLPPCSEKCAAAVRAFRRVWLFSFQEAGRKDEKLGDVRAFTFRGENLPGRKGICSSEENLRENQLTNMGESPLLETIQLLAIINAFEDIASVALSEAQFPRKFEPVLPVHRHERVL